MSIEDRGISIQPGLLLALQSSFLLPTIDKPTHVHRMSTSLIDNIFVHNPGQVLVEITSLTFLIFSLSFAF